MNGHGPVSILCLECEYYQGLAEDPEAEEGVLDVPEIPTCLAYPTGIPSPIAEGLFDHREPFPGKKEAEGRRFKPRTPESRATVKKYFKVQRNQPADDPAE